MVKRWIIGSTLLVGMATITQPSFARAPRIVDDNATVILRGNVHPLARPEFNVGATDYALPMERMVLSLRIPPARQADLDRLIAEQQDPSSPNYRNWLTPEEFGRRFGPETEDIETLTGWLTSHGFVVDEVAKSRTWINFSGKVADVERTFRTAMHDYYVDGHLRHANSQDPQIPQGLADLVSGIVSLHNFPRKSMHSGVRPLEQGNIQSDYTSGGSHYLSPADFATIYNINALYDAGIDGTGQSIAIVGRTHPSSTNWATFRSSMGLPPNPPQVIVNGHDPGDQGAGEDSEADLDVEWSGAVAKNATILFVVSKSTFSSDGVDLSAQYIVDNNLAPVMSTSFGLCESLMGTAGNTFYNSLWQQAAAQGITSFVSTGDSGAAGCSSGNASSGSGLGVNGLASTPYNTAVGGTQFNEGSGSYWNGTNGPGNASALGYIPETTWNESGAAPFCPPGDICSNLWATGGGASGIYGKPAWQVAPGVPSDSKRDIPDVSLAASDHDAYLVQTQGKLQLISGTSAASPSFAGIMALVVQSTGQRQGNANPRLYQLAASQYGSGGDAVFHDITSGSNSVPGVTGYSATAGYDLATGLGSVDVSTLVAAWNAGVPQTISGAPVIGTAVAGVGQATVNFSPPSSSGGSQITLYTATSNPGGFTATGTHSPLTVKGLTTGTAYTFTVTATNNVGTSPPSSASNSVTPFIPMFINNNSPYTRKTAVTLTLNFPGSATMQFSTNGTTWTGWGAYATTKSLKLPAGDGMKTVSVRFRDNNQVVSAIYSATITLDMTRPVNGTLAITPGAGAFTLDWQGFSDATSGIAGYRLVAGTSSFPACTATPVYTGTGTSFVQTGVVTGKTYYFRVCAQDNAGNTSTGATAKLKAP